MMIAYSQDFKFMSESAEVVDLTDYEMYKLINEDVNRYETEVNGKVITNYCSNFFNYYKTIDEFTRKVITSSEPPFKKKLNSRGGINFDQLALGGYYYLMNVLQIPLPTTHEVSENIKLCFNCYNALNIEPEFIPKYPDRRFPNMKSGIELFIDLVTLMREESKKPEHIKNVRGRKYNSARNYESLKKYVDALFLKYGRLMVVRVDFGYLEKYRSSISLDEAYKHLNRFFNNQRSNKLFKHFKGYIWKIEYTEQKKYHFHLMLFFYGEKVHKDGFKGLNIGKYWNEEITSGQGEYYSCNSNKHRYKKLGIGNIHHTETEKRQTLLEVVKYLAKTDQFLKVKLSSKGRVIGRGVMPDESAIKVRRPRKVLTPGAPQVPNSESLGS